jgi:hypothetical protein
MMKTETRAGSFLSGVAVGALLATLLCLFCALGAEGSIKTTECTDVGGAVEHTLFVCSPGIASDSLSIRLRDEEIAAGVEFVSVTAPVGIVATFTPVEIGLAFPLLPPLECIPVGPGGVANRIRIRLASPDSSAAVIETWRREGVAIAALSSHLECPPGTTSVEETSWGRIRSLYR